MSLADLIPRVPEGQEFVKAAELARWLGVSLTTLHKWAQEGKLPKPTRLSPRVSLFRVADVVTALKALDKPAPRKRKGVKYG